MSTSQWTANDLPKLHGHTVIITGASSGIGKVAARELVRAGASVTLAVRDLAKGKAAAATMSGDVIVRKLDLTSLNSVRTFATETNGSINILIDNAGIMATPYEKTEDGFEKQFGTNHLGHFALTNLLLPKITDRVVVVSSNLHRNGSINFADLNYEQRPYKAMGAYSQSKLANLLFVFELNRRLSAARSSIKTVSAHPGYAATNLMKKSNNPIMNLAVAFGNNVIAQSDTMGALPTLYAATVDIPGGTLIGPDGFQHMRGHPTIDHPSAAALDAKIAEQLWHVSEQLTNVTWPLALVNAQ